MQEWQRKLLNRILLLKRKTSFESERLMDELNRPVAYNVLFDL